MSNLIYNQQRNLARHLKRVEVARQLNSKLKRKSARMLKVTKPPKQSPDSAWTRPQCIFPSIGTMAEFAVPPRTWGFRPRSSGEAEQN
jgi:hypothetical protein